MADMFSDHGITPKRIKKELIILLVCFLASTILNVLWAIGDKTPVAEMVARLYVVLVIALVFYGSAVILRILYYLISRFWFRK
jgi:hypothetical protein